MGTSVGELLAGSSGEPGSRVELQLSEQESRFLNSIRRYSPNLNEQRQEIGAGNGEKDGCQRRVAEFISLGEQSSFAAICCFA